MAANDEIIESREDHEDSIPKDDIYRIEEIQIEEMAIDGICGVY
jgi:mycofactocin precursor